MYSNSTKAEAHAFPEFGFSFSKADDIISAILADDVIR